MRTGQRQSFGPFGSRSLPAPLSERLQPFRLLTAATISFDFVLARSTVEWWIAVLSRRVIQSPDDQGQQSTAAARSDAIAVRAVHLHHSASQPKLT